MYKTHGTTGEEEQRDRGRENSVSNTADELDNHHAMDPFVQNRSPHLSECEWLNLQGLVKWRCMTAVQLYFFMGEQI